MGTANVGASKILRFIENFPRIDPNPNIGDDVNVAPAKRDALFQFKSTTLERK
jgi:hypothetical protein